MADRTDWERATRHQRHQAVAADAELRRRHPEQPWPPLRSAEAASAETDSDPQSTAQGPDLEAIAQQTRDLAAQHREFIDRLAERQSLMVPAEDHEYEDLGPAFPAWPTPAPDAILQPPKPRMSPSERILEQTADRDPDWEGAG
jgi:hypothetical protein